MFFCHQAIFSVTRYFEVSVLATPSKPFESTSNLCFPSSQRGLLTKWDHLEAVTGWWELEAWILWEVSWREKEQDKRRSGEAVSTKPCRESLSACRMVITGHEERRGKKAEISRLQGCRPWALNITTMLTSLSFRRDHRMYCIDRHYVRFGIWSIHILIGTNSIFVV